MPWVNEEMCSGCGVCVAECPVGAIEQDDAGMAKIDESECIRCGVCHDACPQDAVRHDGERIPLDVAENLKWARRLLGHFEQPEERLAFMGRMERFFKKQMKVANQTLEVVLSAGDRPDQALDEAIRRLESR